MNVPAIHREILTVAQLGAGLNPRSGTVKLTLDGQAPLSMRR